MIIAIQIFIMVMTALGVVGAIGGANDPERTRMTALGIAGIIALVVTLLL